MDELQKEAFTKNYKMLITNIKVYNVLDHLVQEQALTVQDSERCSSGYIYPTSQEAARCLVNLILESDRPNIFSTFIEALQEPYEFLAEQLRTTYSDLCSKETVQRRNKRPLRRADNVIRESAMINDLSSHDDPGDLSLSLDTVNIGFSDTSNASADLASTVAKSNGDHHPNNGPHSQKTETKKDSTSENMDQPKKRMGSSRRRMLRNSGGLSKEAGVESLFKLSTSLAEEELPPGFDEVDNVDPFFDPPTLKEDIHFAFMERRELGLRVGIYLQESPDGGFIISKILKDGLAIQQTDLQPGDIVVYVNGKEVSDMPLDDVKELIDSAQSSPQLIFGVRRSGYFYKDELEVTLERASMSLSYGLRYIFGRSRPRKPGDQSVYVTRVESGSVAEAEGVRVGDDILAINDCSLETTKHSGDVERLFQESCIVCLKLTRRTYSESPRDEL